MAVAVARLEGGNVSDASQAFRMRLGVLTFAFGLVLGVALLKLGLSREWRVLVAIPFMVAGQGISSSVCKTCSIMAARGMREGQDGAEKIGSPEERRCIRSLGTRSLLSGFLVTGLMTLPFVLLE